MSPLDDEATGARFERLAPEYQAAFARFLRRHYRAGLQQLHRRLRHASTPLAALAEAPEQSSQAFSQRVCAQRLLDFNAQLGTLLFRHPEQLLPLFHAALAKEVSCNAGQPLEGGGLPSVPLKARRKLKVRVENLPPVPPLRKPAISAIRSNDVKQLIQIAGTVVRTGLIKMQETEREYQCCNARCGHRFLVKSDPEQGNVLEIPVGVLDGYVAILLLVVVVLMVLVLLLLAESVSVGQLRGHEQRRQEAVQVDAVHARGRRRQQRRVGPPGDQDPGAGVQARSRIHPQVHLGGAGGRPRGLNQGWRPGDGRGHPHAHVEAVRARCAL